MANKKGNRLTIRTRQALIEAYIDLLRKNPSKNISIKEICAHADLSRPTFYAHFQTKEEILLTYLDKVLEEMHTEFRTHTLDNEEGISYFSTAATHFFQIWQSQPETYALIKAANAEPLFIKRMIAHHLDTYYLIADHIYQVNDPEIIDYAMAHLSYTFYGILDHWIQNGMKRSPQELGEIIAILVDPLSLKRLAEKFN